MSKFLDDDWLIDHDLMEVDEGPPVLEKAWRPVLSVYEDMTVGAIRRWFTVEHPEEEEVVVVTKTGLFKGIMTRQLLVKLAGVATSVVVRDVELKRRARKIEVSRLTEGRVKKALEIHGNVFVVDEEKDAIVENWKGRISRVSFLM
jgi:hypothetical protein